MIHQIVLLISNYCSMKLINTVILNGIVITSVVSASSSSSSSSSTETSPVQRSSSFLGVSDFVARLLNVKPTTPIDTSSEESFSNIQVIDIDKDLVIVTSDGADKGKPNYYPLDRSKEKTEEGEGGRASEGSLTSEGSDDEEQGSAVKGMLEDGTEEAGATLKGSTRLVPNNTDSHETQPNYYSDDNTDDIQHLAVSTTSVDADVLGTGEGVQLDNPVERFDPEHLIIWEDENTPDGDGDITMVVTEQVSDQEISDLLSTL